MDAYGGGGASRTIDVGRGLLAKESPYVLERDSYGGDVMGIEGKAPPRTLKSSMSVRALNQATTQNETAFDEARARSVSGQRRISSQASARRTIGVFSQHAQSQQNLKVDTLVRDNAYDLQENRGSWKGMSLAEVSRLYSMKNLSLGDLRSHKSVKPYITTNKDGGIYVRYVPEEEKNKKSFYNMIVTHSKQIPNP